METTSSGLTPLWGSFLKSSFTISWTLGIRVEPPTVPILHNVDVASRSSESSIRDALAAQLANPVRWRHTVVAMRERGATTMVEFGPGRVLTGLARRIDRGITANSVHDEKSLDAALRAVTSGADG